MIIKFKENTLYRISTHRVPDKKEDRLAWIPRLAGSTFFVISTKKHEECKDLHPVTLKSGSKLAGTFGTQIIFFKDELEYIDEVFQEEIEDKADY